MNCAKHLLAFIATIAGVASAFDAAPKETAVEAPGPSGPLRGTMLSPSTEHGAVILIIPGSGPTDRDGNSRAGVLAAPYRLLARRWSNAE